MKKALLRIVSTVIVVVFVTSSFGCATHSSRISAQSVSQFQYKHLTCEEIGYEISRVSHELEEASKKQNRSANSDAVSFGVGMLLFWPALFLLATTDDNEDEVARLKGEIRALEDAMMAKDCHTFSG